MDNAVERSPRDKQQHWTIQLGQQPGFLLLNHFTDIGGDAVNTVDFLRNIPKLGRQLPMCATDEN
ncbi:hypothetical protein T265_06614 [Opisthorchis viverrini]|uniref:Uncharacterized protein n=1 Tax=Opisthorchis viverrini TaxID=6198 RepID=A0A075ADF3_OPIVI|nr:hypothetical protein T265_06614 [Opisthorchis viverrini]KER26034.1 hypothetical protein T265_06614 [Opisthorchis viverrini]